MSETRILPPHVVQRLVELNKGTPLPLPNAFEQVLRQLFKALDYPTLKSLVRETTFTIGEMLIRQGESGDFMYLILSGRVLAFAGDLRNPMILGIRGPGEFIGDMSMIDQQPRSATVIAIEPVRALRIERQAFETMLQLVPEMNVCLMQALSLRLRQAEAHRSMEQRSGRLVRLQVERLVEEKRALEAAQQTQEQTINFIVHDLRSPINVIQNVLDMLEMLLPDEILSENRDLFQMGELALRNILDMTETLLDLARYEAGKLELQLSTFSVAEMVETILRMQALLAQNKQITLSGETDAALSTLTADRRRIERVLLNLLDNALKHTPYGGSITVRALPAPFDDGTPGVMFRVNDTGPGIPVEARERIFEPYVQLDTSHGGLGLGLNYCRLTVEAHGGRIWVEDGDNGVGSCFIFVLPQ